MKSTQTKKPRVKKGKEIKGKQEENVMIYIPECCRNRSLSPERAEELKALFHVAYSQFSKNDSAVTE